MVSSERITYKRDYRIFSIKGAEIIYKSYDEWLKDVSLFDTSGHSSVLFPFIPILKDRKWLMRNDAEFNNGSTKKCMESIGFSWPKPLKIVESQFRQLIKEELG